MKLKINNTIIPKKTKMKFPSKIIGKKQPIKNFNIKKIQTANPKKLKNSAVKNKNFKKFIKHPIF